jgi:hypothetical protein
MSSINFFFLFLFIVGAVLVEWWLSTFWAPVYFRYGIPLYRRHFQTAVTAPDLNTFIPQLEGQLTHTFWQPSVVFRALGPQELAFRQSMKQNSRHRDIVRGRLQYEPISQQLTVTGHLYCPSLLFYLALFFSSQMLIASPFFILLILTLLAISVATQRAVYKRVGSVVQTLFNTQETAATANRTSWQEPAQSDWQSNLKDQENYAPNYPTTPQKGLTQLEKVLILILILSLLLMGSIFFVIVFNYLTL